MAQVIDPMAAVLQRGEVDPPMIKIEAIVEPSRAEELQDELEPLVRTITSTEVSWRLRDGRPGVYRGVEYLVDSIPMIKLELLVYRSRASWVVEAIERAVSMSRQGGQLLSASPVDFTLVRFGSGAAQRSRRD
jgi:nitrogen regulatory protein PII